MSLSSLSNFRRIVIITALNLLRSFNLIKFASHHIFKRRMAAVASPIAGDNEAKKIQKLTKAVEEMTVWPDFIEHRIKLFDELMEKYKADLAVKPRAAIKITLPNGKVIDGTSWETTPLTVAMGISRGLADHAVISKVNGELWDLERPLEGDATVSILKFDDEEAKQVFWHSSAHILGEACERFCGGHLCYGPPIESGFYYDMFKEDYSVSRDDFLKIEKIMTNIVKDKQPFERLEMTKEDLLKMFGYNKFKVRILNNKVTTPTTTVYRCGPLIDLCRGPHVRDTGKIKALTVVKASSSYWEGNANAESLQRIYGISFPDAKQLKEWQKFQEEAAKRDHRKIGIDQELYFFNSLSPGTAFWYPKGAHIYNTLMNFLRNQYRKRGFNEVISPNIYNSKLWERSGHWEHYSDDMFRFEVENEQFALKPMNCPGHCLMFSQKPHAYNELPIRFADFGVLHRNEMSGALSGLTRVRRFQQDDAHIFCRDDQISQEIQKCLDFLRFVYVETLGFTFNVDLSTRPKKYLGDLVTWDFAESQLKEALNASGHPWKINEGDGAFYGPKIDIKVKDALMRSHQTGTIQLDFQLPQRFDLHYYDENKEKKRPVMIHRAVFGSLERMIAILAENYGGKWPFWLSPRQAIVITINKKFNDYGAKVHQQIYDAGFQSEFDPENSDTLNRQIRNAQLAQFNFILVVGEKEESNGTVNVRTRDNQVRGELKVEEFIKRMERFQDEYTKDAESAEGFGA